MPRAIAFCALSLLGCVTLGSERTHLISTQTVDGRCTDSFTASVEGGVAPMAHLAVAGHQHCATVERQTWAVSNYSRMASTPRLITAIAVTAALLGGVVGLIAATTPTHRCCTDADRASEESSRIYDAVGIVGVLGVGAAVWALLGVRAESDAPVETSDLELDKRELVHPYSGPLTLGSGKTLQLNGGGAELDVRELDTMVRVGDALVPLEGPVPTLLESAARCASLNSEPAAEAQLESAVLCAHGGWLVPPLWDEQCKASLGRRCREARTP